MTADEALQILGVSASSSESNRHAAFVSQRAKLEQKIADAATSGLKIKYSEALTQLEEAYETLQLSSDAADLPSLRQTGSQAAAGSPEKDKQTETKPQNGNAVTIKRLAIILGSILVLCSGAWLFSSNSDQPLPPAPTPTSPASEQSAPAQRVTPPPLPTGNPASDDGQFSQVLTKLHEQKGRPPWNWDDGLHWRIIMLAKERAAMGFTVPIPSEAQTLAAEGDYLFKNAQNPDDYEKAIDAYEQSLDLAPWQAAPYYNCAIAYEKRGGDHAYLYRAFAYLHWFLLALPDEDSTDKAMGRALMGQIEGKAEQLGIDDPRKAQGIEWTPLVWAAEWGDLVTVRALVNSGADVNQSCGNLGYDDSTPLMLAAAGDHLKVVEFLLNRGAGVNQRDAFGITPLDVASAHGYLDVAQLLINHDADVNARNERGDTPLSLTRDEQMRAFLIAHGAHE